MKRCCQRQTKCNLFILSVSFLLFHSALDLLQILHYGHKSSEGIASLGVLHGVTVFSCLLVPLLLKTFGLKKTMAISGILLLVYATSSSVPSHQVLLPSAILLGLITAPLWSAQCSYLTTLTYRSIENSKETAEQAVGRSVSLFESTTRTSRIFSGLAATFLLKHSNSTAAGNSTIIPECGATNCNPVSYSLLLPQITDNAQKFITIFSAACVLIGVLLLVSFLDDLKENSCGRCSTREALLDTVRLLMNRRLLLLLPLIVCTGIEQAFIVGDFAKVSLIS
ncbi:DgyrCDS11012 [Dimorphilus gyrociliatus]|uniref:DgyrCDS11012 n=1 Tax=Dimorphilus gyrociliatus TaxID=2664684 RepID=A0A7I8W728_9ANNE|nr:DgyrCDS11012 [Dimorphilus gyrociliatus]